ncbi:DUF6545 domain-containing protein [Micromonospora arida]|uniref:DUF6545 domain-containing protein n=1 Tax=Micromonospora arida TaxID=2203715 RepID=UPI003CF5F2DB
MTSGTANSTRSQRLWWPTSWWTDRRTDWQVNQLWMTLRAGMPEAAIITTTTTERVPVEIGGSRQRYRRVVEVHEALRLLRPWYSRQVHNSATQRAQRYQLDATSTAALRQTSPHRAVITIPGWSISGEAGPRVEPTCRPPFPEHGEPLRLNEPPARHRTQLHAPSVSPKCGPRVRFQHRTDMIHSRRSQGGSGSRWSPSPEPLARNPVEGFTVRVLIASTGRRVDDMGERPSERCTVEKRGTDDGQDCQT